MTVTTADPRDHTVPPHPIQTELRAFSVLNIARVYIRDFGLVN